MKHIIKIGLLLLSIVTFFSCDEIKPPFLENPSSVDTNKYTQKILLEEYTGFRCGNCPEATEIAHSLKEKYPNNVILLSVHAGGYAKPTAAHPYDFRTPIGDELDNFFGCSLAGNPNGMVNRVGFPTKSHILREGQWESAILSLLPKKPKIDIDLKASYNANERKIIANITIKMLESSSPNYHLCAYIAEDSVVQYQRDDRLTPPDVENYVHNNVLRDGLTSTWGIPLSDEILTEGSTVDVQFNYTIPPNKDWRPEKLKIIAFVHDKDGTFEILQVEEKYLFPR